MGRRNAGAAQRALPRSPRNCGGRGRQGVLSGWDLTLPTACTLFTTSGEQFRGQGTGGEEQAGTRAVARRSLTYYPLLLVL